MPNTQAATRPTTTTPKQGQLFEMTPEREQEAQESFEAAGKRREKFNTNLTRAVAILIGRTTKTPSGRNLTRHDMAVLYCDLLTMGGPDGYAYRPDGQLAEELGSHPSTVNRSRRKLRECGFIVVAKRVRGRGNRIVLGPMLTLVADMVKASEASTSDHVGRSSSDHVGRSSSDHSSQNTSDQRRRMSSDHVGQSVREDSGRPNRRENPLEDSLSTVRDKQKASEQALADEYQHPRPLRGGADSPKADNEQETDSEQTAYANQDDYFAANNNLHTDSERQPRSKRTKTRKRKWQPLNGQCLNDQNNPNCLGETKRDKNGKPFPRCWPCQDIVNKAKRQDSHSDAREHKPRALPPPPPRSSAPSGNTPRPNRLPTRSSGRRRGNTPRPEPNKQRNLNGVNRARESLGPSRMPPGGRARAPEPDTKPVCIEDGCNNTPQRDRTGGYHPRCKPCASKNYARIRTDRRKNT